MKSLPEIQAAISRLSPAEMRLVRDWLENQLEDHLEMTDDFKGRVESSERQMFRSPPRGRLRLSPLHQSSGAKPAA